MQPILSDSALLAAFAASRDHSAFAALVARHGPMVLAVCRSRLASAADAEDAAQAVFLTLANHARSLQSRTTVAGWLHRVAWYIASRAAQAAAIRRRHEQKAAAMNPESQLPDAPHDPEALHAAIEKLPDKYRLPLLLHHFEGRTQAETASLLGLTESAASVRLTRARDLLRKRLAGAPLLAAPALLTPALTTKILTSATATSQTAAIAALSKGASHMLTAAKLKLTATILLPLATAAALTLYAAAPATQPATVPAPPPPRLYNLTLIPSLGGLDNNAAAINNHSQIVGSSELNPADHTHHAFLYDNGKLSDLGTLPTGTLSFATAINDNGQIVGASSYTPNPYPKSYEGIPYHAFLYHDHRMQDLGAIAGISSTAFAINDAGQIVGDSDWTAFNPGGGNATHAVLYDHDKIIDLGGQASFARSINNAGKIAGASFFNQLAPDGTDSLHAALFSNENPENLGTLGGYLSVAYAVNAAGDIAGFIRTGSPLADTSPQHAIVIHQGNPTDLGNLPGGSASTVRSSLNDRGQIVGEAVAKDDQPHAFLYENNTLYDLNTALPTGTLAANHLSALSRATAINNLGQIVGTATTTDNRSRAFLLTPIPKKP